ncbi:MAG: gamma-glutamyltransferase [Rhodospirillales bacterium]|jgi:gamma-glutamyltranspeptidase/glutathione hydrolase|nr:gamma-glutamyltransferase [Rhodospirillaceae bacterium]MDP6429121.1 gamma-glutamyltransferase [Rhodospirillales bacterium]MDP6645695.1 gamma-glutamyltransferase [Rhodospirillales bacterium]MDP6842864.1 gamma-glutamyltransferase [Rhodospirillales bacterium]
MRPLDQPGRSTVFTTNGMAATSQPLSSITAIEILRSGGNAMDAAVAAVAVQCVVEPQSTGIGGDCFCLYSPKGEGVVAFNGSGRAPAAAAAEWYLENGIERIERQSPHAVTIPGAVDAWCRLLADHGSMALDRILQPAIRLARDGFPIGHRTQSDWELAVLVLAQDPTAAKYYLKNGQAPALGSLVKLPLLAKSLETIAANGRAGFYEGAIAADMVNFLKSKGGLHSLDDFAGAHGEYVTPIKTGYRGYEVYECPPNGQGIVALEMLNILSGFDLGSLDPVSAERLHLEIEAARLAYRDRGAALGDPDFSEIPVAAWLSAEHADAERARIDPGKRLPDLPASNLPRHEDTVYLTVVDKDRNAVSFINTLFFPFGSGLVAPESGIILQNRGQGFVIEPGHANCIEPNKRPLHTIIPGMLVKDGRAQMPFGVMGGQYQACGHAHLLTNLLDWEMDLQEAVDLTRVFPDVDDPEQQVQVESGLPEDARAGLEKLGHKTYLPNRPIGGAQAIWIDWQEGVLRGASEPRKDGMAIGY